MSHKNEAEALLATTGPQTAAKYGAVYTPADKILRIIEGGDHQ